MALPRALYGAALFAAGALLVAIVALADGVRFRDTTGASERFDLLTVVGTEGAPFELCWQRLYCEAAGDCTEPYNVQFHRYRAEDGQSQMGALLHRSEWQQGPTAGQWCASFALPERGHWIYELRFCGPPLPGQTEPQCRTMTSTKSEQVGSATWSRPWWIYTYTPRAGARPMWPENVKIVAPII